MNGTIKTASLNFYHLNLQLFKQMATLFYFSLLNINNTDGLFIPRIINTFAALIKKAMKFDIKKHIYLILLFILSFTVETAQSQEVPTSI